MMKKRILCLAMALMMMVPMMKGIRMIPSIK